MKSIIYLILLLFPHAVGAQISSYKYYRADSTVSCEIIQLDSITDLHRHIIYYHENGQKASEFFDKNRVIYDTLNSWYENGGIRHQEFYSDTGYIEVSYYYNGQIFEIGTWKKVDQRTQEITVRDSSTFYVYETTKCKEACYERFGIWKTYFSNGKIKDEGVYLPMEFELYIPDSVDINNVAHSIKKTSFDMTAESGGIYSTFLREGKWIFYKETGEIKEEIIYVGGLPKEKGYNTK